MYRIGQEEIAAVARAIESKDFFKINNSGREVFHFEEEWKSFSGSPYALFMTSGFAALTATLVGMGIGPGDEVIVPANTYIATWLAVSQVGATPVPVEPDWRTYNLDPSKIEAAITPRTTAIAVVHLYGMPADMDPIMEIAARHHLFVLEDVAQAQGAFYKGRRTGHLGHAGAFSFYPAKNIGAFGEAGGVTTDDPAIADRIRVLRNYGSRVKYHNEVKGYNRRIDGLQAAFLAVKTPHLDEWNARRRRIASLYKEELANVPGLVLPPFDLGASVWHQFVVRVRDRDAVQARLKEKDVPTMVHYPIPPHLSEAYADMGFRRGDFPITEEMADTFLSIPIGPHMPEEDAHRVARILAAAVASS